jgi:hypothetical protein
MAVTSWKKANLRRMALALIVLMLTGCAHHYTQAASNDPYGFFSGLWHGVIFPLTATVNIASWLLGLVDISFLSDIEIIGRPNTGVFYYFGFAVGFVSASGSSTRA